MSGRIRVYGDERGATLALVAVSMAALLGMAAIAVDLSMLYKVRNDAQRAADAAALAGASAYMNHKPNDAVGEAWVRALDYTRANFVGGKAIDVSDTNVYAVGSKTYADFPEGQIQVIPDSEKVRVIIKRNAVDTWFGNILGKHSVLIAAKAAAVASTTGSGKCIKPFAFPDYWSDADNDTYANRLEDLGNGQGPNNGERWQWDATVGDKYFGWKDPRTTDSTQWTGLGSHFRNNSVYKDDSKTGTKYWDDYGRPIVLKKSNPQQTMAPSFFLPWVLPGSNPGAQGYKNNIVSCNPVSINLNQEYSVDPTADTSSYDNKTGNMIGPTKQAMDSLISLDPKACWAPAADPNHPGYTGGSVKQLDASGNCTVDYPGWEGSPRVILIPLMDPSLADNGKTKLKFNNIAMLFVEEQKGRHDPVVGRFLYFAKGTGPTGPSTGPLMKKLRLVE